MNDFILKELSKDIFYDFVDIIKQLKKIPNSKNIKEKHNKKSYGKFKIICKN